MVRPRPRIVAVDWSGRATGERRHLWLAELVGDEPTPGRLWNASRAEAGDQLIELAEHDDELLVGLDFGFSLPAWFLHEHGIQDVEELWQDTARLERWLTACEPPFWGRPGRRCPPADQHRPALRWCERRCYCQPVRGNRPDYLIAVPSRPPAGAEASANWAQ